jgi:hypothetical protein
MAIINPLTELPLAFSWRLAFLDCKVKLSFRSCVRWLRITGEKPQVPLRHSKLGECRRPSLQSVVHLRIRALESKGKPTSSDTLAAPQSCRNTRLRQTLSDPAVSR